MPQVVTRHRRIAASVAAVLAVLWLAEQISAVTDFVGQTIPQLATFAKNLPNGSGQGVLTILALGAVVVLVYLVSDGDKYRRALPKVVRDYYAVKSDLEHQLDKVSHGPADATIQHGYADAAFAESVYKLYGVPTEPDGKYGG